LPRWEESQIVFPAFNLNKEHLMRNRALVVAALLATCAVGAIPAHANPMQATSTPIKHLVVIFQENVSFDHYFGTYPNAANPGGEPSFTPSPRTPTVNGLSEDLLTMNPNVANPFRLDRSQELICRRCHT
jgi:phospholipase C